MLRSWWRQMARIDPIPRQLRRSPRGSRLCWNLLSSCIQGPRREVLILLYTLVMGVFPSLLLALWSRYLARWRVPWLLSRCVRTATRTFLLETLRQGRSPHSRRERECRLPPLRLRVGAMGPQSLFSTGWGPRAHRLFNHGDGPGDPRLFFVRGWGSDA